MQNFSDSLRKMTKYFYSVTFQLYICMLIFFQFSFFFHLFILCLFQTFWAIFLIFLDYFLKTLSLFTTQTDITFIPIDTSVSKEKKKTLEVE